MKKYFLYVYAILLILIFGCKKKVDYESYFKTEKYNKSRIIGDKIKLDTIFLDKIESSYIGDVEYLDNEIVFVDSRFCWVYIYDLKGKVIDKKLGQGRGPEELNTSFIDGYCFLDNGKRIFIGSSNDIHIYDKNWKKLKQTHINWNGSVKYGTAAQVIKNPSPNEPSIYSVEYANLKMKSYGNSVYVPIYSEHPKFNGFTGFEYYKEGNILAELDLENVEIKRLFGRRTPELLKYKYLMHHSMFRFDIDKNNNFYVSHEIDSLIYVYDKEFSVKYAFGVSGKGMDTNYQQLEKLDRKKFQQLYFEDRPTRGYYSAIKVFEDQGIVFRSYKKNEQTNNDGLQIYKDKVLVMDIDVPENLEIKEYIHPYFYSNALINEETEQIEVIRLKLPNNL